MLAAKRTKVERVIRFFRPNWDTNYSECVGLAHYDTLGAQFVLRGADVREQVTTGPLLRHMQRCSVLSLQTLSISMRHA